MLPETTFRSPLWSFWLWLHSISYPISPFGTELPKSSPDANYFNEAADSKKDTPPTHLAPGYCFPGRRHRQFWQTLIFLQWSMQEHLGKEGDFTVVCGWEEKGSLVQLTWMSLADRYDVSCGSWMQNSPVPLKHTRCRGINFLEMLLFFSFLLVINVIASAGNLDVR